MAAADDDDIFLLAEDGMVHIGEARRTMEGTMMVTDCAEPAKRPLYPGETWWADAAWRHCPKCMKEVVR